MASYTTPDLNDYLPGEPLTSAKALLMVENPIAIAEGGTNAPYVQNTWHPYNGTHWTDGNDGSFYDASVDGALSSVETPTFESGYEYKMELRNVSHNGPFAITNTVSIDLFTGSYTTAVSSSQVVYSTANGESGFSVDLPSAHFSARVHLAEITGWRAEFGGSSGTGVDRGVFQIASASVVTKARVSLSSNSFSGSSKFMLYRRRVV